MWELQQLQKLEQTDPELVHSAIERLLENDQSLKWKIVVGAYLQERINFGKTAELLGEPAFDLKQKFMKQGIPVRIGPETEEEVLSEIASAEIIFKTIQIS